MRPMRSAASALTIALLLAPAGAYAAEEPALARARTRYNAADYDGAIAAAREAQQKVGAADAASLVAARARLERFRMSPVPADLTDARDALRGIVPARLNPRDQVDLLVALGQSLFLSETFGAAAELFDSALSRAALLPPRDRSRLLDWWATALDREAQARPSDRRAVVFERILTRMERLVSDDPANPTANYWLAVSARGLGDLDRAWNVAIAAWVRTTMDAIGKPAARADLDKLVTEALIPERTRQRPAHEQADAITALRAEWDAIKTQWP